MSSLTYPLFRQSGVPPAQKQLLVRLLASDSEREQTVKHGEQPCVYLVTSVRSKEQKAALSGYFLFFEYCIY